MHKDSKLGNEELSSFSTIVVGPTQCLVHINLGIEWRKKSHRLYKSSSQWHKLDVHFFFQAVFLSEIFSTMSKYTYSMI